MSSGGGARKIGRLSWPARVVRFATSAAQVIRHAVVVVLWLVWRAVSTPFRRDEPFHTLPQAVQMLGYNCETHLLTTDDGYLLTAFRILPPQGAPASPRPVVVLWHGLLDSAYTWLFLGRRSLALMLCDAGYDVWLANNRGNKYSCRHAFADPKQPDFWQFTYDEFARTDLPNTLRFVLHHTGAAKLAYIGHSEGTTQFFAGASLDPSLADRVSCFVGLGPVASVSNIGGLFRLLAVLRLDEVLQWLGVRKQVMASPKALWRTVVSFFCALMPWVADDVVDILCGKEATRMDPNRVADWVQHEPSGTSALNLCHWAQCIRIPTPQGATGLPSFRMHDFGARENQRRYNSPTPPLYPIQNIPTTLPMLLCGGGRDTLANPTDVDLLLGELDRANVRFLPLANFNHTDFLWSVDAPKELYAPVLAFLETEQRKEGLEAAKQLTGSQPRSRVQPAAQAQGKGDGDWVGAGSMVESIASE